jgi:hypothetical protein
MAQKEPDYSAPFEGPSEEDPLWVALLDFKTNTAYYARRWLSSGEIAPSEHPIITEKLASWRSGFMAATPERRAAILKSLGVV